MFLELRRYPFLGSMIDGAPEEPGVYLLWEDDELTHIAATGRGAASLRARLRDHLAGAICCGCRPTHYSWRLSRLPGVLVSEWLSQYRSKFQIDPRCNRSGP